MFSNATLGQRDMIHPSVTRIMFLQLSRQRNESLSSMAMVNERLVVLRRRDRAQIARVRTHVTRIISTSYHRHVQRAPAAARAASSI